MCSSDLEALTTDYVINRKGVRRPVSMSDAYYSQFAVKFTGSSCFNVAETSSLFRSVVYVARRFFSTRGEIYDDGQVREFLMWLLKPSTTELYKYNYQFRPVHWYAVTFAKPIYNSSDSVNPLKSLLGNRSEEHRLNSSHSAKSRMPSSA